MPRTLPDRVAQVIDAFSRDGFEVQADRDVFYRGDRFGARAEHRTAFNYQTKEPKRAYYLEGDPLALGWLLGRMAEPQVARMTEDFLVRIVPDFLDPDLPDCLAKLLGEIILDVVRPLAARARDDVPQIYLDEMEGLVAGCQAANPRTKVCPEDLLALNLGIDCLLSLVYRPDRIWDLLRERQREAVGGRIGAAPGLTELFELQPEWFRLPLMCNAFSACGEAAGGGHYFGRDFMFPNAGAFQDVAALIVYRPDPVAGLESVPFVSMTAPGLLGSVAAMNLGRGRVDRRRGGLGIGVNLVAGGNCNPKRPGFNSLLLARDCLQHADSFAAALDRIEAAQRGVCWLYPLADGQSGDACTVEVGEKVPELDFLSYPPADLQRAGLLPDQRFLDSHVTTEDRKGMLVREGGFIDGDYLAFDPGLFARFGKRPPQDALDPAGRINPDRAARNCPQSYYFAPQRECRPDLMLVTNHFLIPEMRLVGMHPWVSRLAAGDMDDIQWRYDVLNAKILGLLANRQVIDFARARELIDFLRPYWIDAQGERRPGEFPDYYTGPTSTDGQEIQISGSVSIMDLQDCVIESHYGYYCDGWVRISLANYV